MPLTPGGASGRRASTRWITFSVIPWSPQVMKILLPKTRKWSPSRSARAATAARSEPACGSVRFMVPVHSPAIIFGR